MHPPRPAVYALVLAIAGGVLGLALLPGRGTTNRAREPDSAPPRERCRQCHEREYAQWAGTPHALHGRARAVPTGGASLSIGSVWMQAYFRPDGEGRHRIVPICKDLRSGEWRQVGAVLREIAGQGPHVLPADPSPLEERSFESDCAGCHASGVSLAHDLERRRVVGGWRDVAIDCEACHGNGDEHIRVGGADGSIAALSDLSPRAQVAICGRCHGGPPTADGFEPEDAIHWLPLMTDQEGLHPNGEAAGQSYQAEPIMRTGCYRDGGLTCLTCHGAHATELVASGSGDVLCLSCHSTYGAPHTHHRPDSVGSHCVECHMPRLREGVLVHQRTHHIGVPLPALAGIPNACKTCHADQTDAWREDAWQRWWGTPPKATLDAAAAVRAAREDDPDALAMLERVRDHPDPFYRAVVIQYAGAKPDARMDPNPLVRLAAAHSAARRGDLDYLRRALNDSEARVRGEAAIALFSAGEEIASRHWDDVGIVAQQGAADVTAHLLRALISGQRGDDDTARATFQRLLARAPNSLRAWMAWAEFESDRRYDINARRALERGLARWMETERRGHASWDDLERYLQRAINVGKLRWARVLLRAYEQHLRRPDLRQRVEAVRRRFQQAYGGG